VAVVRDVEVCGVAAGAVVMDSLLFG